MRRHVSACSVEGAAAGAGAPPPPPVSHPPLPPTGPDTGFYRFTTASYNLHHLEVPTGYKFVLTADAAAGIDLRDLLWRIYADAFCGYAMKNPLYVPGTPIDCIGFARAVDDLVRVHHATAIARAGAPTLTGGAM